MSGLVLTAILILLQHDVGSSQDVDPLMMSIRLVLRCDMLHVAPLPAGQVAQAAQVILQREEAAV
jgi:hypothetical protein